MALSSTAACASCIFGAVSSTTLSFSAQVIETITVHVTPLITVYPGVTTITNYESVTQSLTEIVGGASSKLNATKTTYSDVNRITWHVGDATLTYPTTYVQYLGFEGAAATNGNGETCAKQTDVKMVDLPASTDVASFIYPVTGLVSMPAPTALLDYLGTLDSVAAQFNGDDLAGCAPLASPGPPIGCGTNLEQQRLVERKKEETSSIIHSSNTVFWMNSTRLTHSATIDSSRSYSSAQPGSSTSLAITISDTSNVPTTSTAGFHTPGTALISSLSSVSGLSCPVSNSFGRPKTLTTTTTISEHHGPNPHNPLPASSSAVPTYTHHTAVGITAITGSAIVTTSTGTPPRVGEGPPGGSTTKDATKEHVTTARSPLPHNPDSTTTGHHNHHTPAGGSGSPPHRPIVQPGHHTGGGGNGDGPRSHPGAPTFSFHHTKITAGHGRSIVVGGHTVHAGQTVTLGKGASRTTLALQMKGGTTNLVVDGTTYNPRPGGSTRSGAERLTAVPPHAIITAGGNTITAVRSGSSIIVKDGHSRTTIGPGSIATFDGQTISVPRHGSSVVVNGKTTALTNPVTTASEVVITTRGHTFTVIDGSGSIIVEGASTTATVRDGSTITFERQTIRAGRHGTAIVINGETTKATPTIIGASASSSSNLASPAGSTASPLMRLAPSLIVCALLALITLL